MVWYNNSKSYCNNAIGNCALGCYESTSWEFGFTINGYTGSTAETYARENGIRFTSLGTLIPDDFNGDNSVDLKDVELLRRCIAGGWNVKLNTKHAVLNKDGNVNLKDVAILRRYIAGGWNVTLQ